VWGIFVNGYKVKRERKKQKRGRIHGNTEIKREFGNGRIGGKCWVCHFAEAILVKKDDASNRGKKGKNPPFALVLKGVQNKSDACWSSALYCKGKSPIGEGGKG